MIVLCKALREQGIDAQALHFRKRGYEPDLILHLQQADPADHNSIKQRFLKQAVEEIDIFHFHYGTTFFEDFSDLEYLKKRGKVLIMQHRGSDARRLSIARNAGNPFVQVKRSERYSEETIVRNLKRFSTVIDHAVVADHELAGHVQGYYKHVHLIRQAIDLPQFAPTYPQPGNERPFIIHAPTHQNVKGTDYVLRAIERLRHEGYAFEFDVVRNKKHKEALRLYKRADIVIDQLLIGSFGIFSLEAMALGKPVLCFVRDDLVQHYPPGLPIVNANPMTIYEQLRLLITAPGRREQLGRMGRAYVETYYKPSIAAGRLAGLYRQLMRDQRGAGRHGAHRWTQRDRRGEGDGDA